MQKLSTQQKVGDTIRAKLVFYSGEFKDTLKVKSIRRVSSTGIVSRSQSKHSYIPKGSDHTFNLAGRNIIENGFMGYKVHQNKGVLQIRK